MFRLSAFFLLLSSAVSVQGQVPVTVNMRSFSSAIKDGKLEANTEKLLYAHNTGEAGVITEQWFTGEVTDGVSIYFLSSRALSICTFACRSRSYGRKRNNSHLH